MIEMARMKRKRETGSGDAEARDARIADPYALAAKPCRLSDHRKKSKAGWTVVRNCAENPNCLYGLGEHQKVGAAFHIRVETLSALSIA